jgi:hypothetical protein
MRAKVEVKMTEARMGHCPLSEHIYAIYFKFS